MTKDNDFLSRYAFELLVGGVLKRIPERFSKKVAPLVFLIEDEPSTETLRENGISPGEGTLLGLYHGIPKTERGVEYGVGGTMPDTITLFQKPIEDAAREEGKSVEVVIEETVWHELGHYFGMEEHEVRGREIEGTNRYDDR